MKKVTVDKDVLLATVIENRAKHRDIFLDAQKGYRKQMIKELDQMLSDAKDGRKIVRSVAIPEPEDHTKDYDRIIEMLRLSVDDEIELEVQDFDRYVMDRWEWSSSFAFSNMRYTTTAE